MTVAVDLLHEDTLSGQRRPAARGTFEMVAVDAAGRPTPISVSRHSNDVQEEAVT
jgi:acyl-CoA hydrolase